MEYNRAYERTQQLKKFYKHLMWFGIVATFIFIRKYLKYGNIEHSLFGGSIILTIWAIVLIVKAVKLFVLNDEWENKIYQEELKKAKKPISF